MNQKPRANTRGANNAKPNARDIKRSADVRARQRRTEALLRAALMDVDVRLDRQRSRFQCNLERRVAACVAFQVWQRVSEDALIGARASVDAHAERGADW